MKYYEVDFKISTAKETMQDARDLLASGAGEVGFETFEDTENGIMGYIQTDCFDKDELDRTIDEFPIDDVSITYTIKDAEDSDWNEQWENEGFEPIVISDKCVIHDGRHKPDTSAPITVEIDAKLAFGTGNHETTKMIVAALQDMDLAGKTMLDCGCGTGILGIVALKCGAKSATGYDIDEWSVDNARHNAVINCVDDRYESLLGNASVIGTVINKKFDIVVANINRNILLNDMAQFRKAMNDGATLILSGFYTEDIVKLEAEANKLGMKLISQRSDNNWACVVF